MGRSKSLPKTRASPEMGRFGMKLKAMEYWSEVWWAWLKYGDVLGEPSGKPGIEAAR